VAKLLANFRLIIALALVIVLAIILMSACDINVGRSTNQPAEATILAPASGGSVLINSPVQIQSAYPNDAAIARVELWVEPVEQPSAAKLLRADTPQAGIVLQQWLPKEAGSFTIRLKAYNADNQLLSELAHPLTIVDDVPLVVQPPADTAPQADTAYGESTGDAFAAPTTLQPQAQTPTAQPAAPTPVPFVDQQPATQPVEPAGQAQDAAVTILATATPAPTPTPIPRYPAPPPIPGVPPGPTQAELPKAAPPVCDSAEYLGPFIPADPDVRQVIIEDDDIAAKTTGGTKVHRIWKLRNTGTCTWGPGYELAFYGGRAMGSGGVPFEGFFGYQPERRNYIEDSDHLIVPEGYPNQVALAEVVLNVPVIPGIHQSYWRMRNPQGVFFGPIVGVTLEVVRECDFGIYGAPQINKFEILGVGDVFRPENPVDVRAEICEAVTLDWSIINVDNYDILIKEPTGDVTNLATRNLTDRRGFVPNELGEHTITLFADNGSCHAEAHVKVDVIPCEGGGFNLDINLANNAPVVIADAHAAFSPDVQPGTVEVLWQHFEQDVDEILFHADLYRKVSATACPPFVDPNGSMNWMCWDESKWTLDKNQPLGQIGQTNKGSTTVCNSSLPSCAAIQQGDPTVQSTMTIAEHQQLIFCKPSNSDVKYGVLYYLEAKKDGLPASLSESNQVFVECDGVGQPRQLPTELE